MHTEIISSTPDCEIVTVRILNAERERVFRAWSEPVHLQNWWGPAGFTNTFKEFDFRVGGMWRLTMHGPEKGNYENESVFIKIERPSLIVWNRVSKPLFQVVVLLDEVAKDKTRVTFKMIFASAEECDKIRPFATPKNEENFDKLEAELLKMS